MTPAQPNPALVLLVTGLLASLSYLLVYAYLHRAEIAARVAELRLRHEARVYREARAELNAMEADAYSLASRYCNKWGPPGYSRCTRLAHPADEPCAHDFAHAQPRRVLGSVKLLPAARDLTLDELSALVASQLVNDPGFRSALAMRLSPLMDPPPVDVEALAVEVAQLIRPAP